jgi:hypothetical protein
VEVGEEDAGAELGDGLTVAAGLGVGLELLVGGAGFGCSRMARANGR